MSRRPPKVREFICESVWHFLIRDLLDFSGKTSKKGLVEKSVLRSLDQLMEIDSKKTAMIVYHHMHPYIPLVLEALSRQEGCKRKKFEFTKFILEYKESGSQPSTPARKAVKAEDVLSLPETYEEFIRLMCEFDPRSVASYVKGKVSLYRPKNVLKICQEYGLTDAQAFLLEQEGRIAEAFKLIKEDLDSEFSRNVENMNRWSLDDQTLSWSRINTKMILLIQLCQRNSCNSDQSESMWFELLESVLRPQRAALEKGKDKLQSFKDVVKHVVNSALGYVSLRILIEKIVTDPVYKGDKYGDVKEFFASMLGMYHYEEATMKASCSAFKSDIRSQLGQKVERSNAGLCSPGVYCDLCQKHLAGFPHSVVFQCRHIFHTGCLEKAGCVLVNETVTSSEIERWQCYVCMSKVASNLSGEVIADSTAAGNETKAMLNNQDLEDITDQRVAKAREYCSKMKSRCCKESFFQSPDFDLRLAPGLSNRD